ncbi:MAG: peptidase, partial [Proteobacteria bacterium]|nr:peptidase [Pseudomonadota bacterium]
MMVRAGTLFAVCLLFAIATCGMAATPAAGKPDPVFAHTQVLQGLLPVHVDKRDGRILVTLPAAGADGVSARFLYTASLRTGLGSAPTFLDRGRIGNTQI